MRILIANDDGIYADGIYALAKALVNQHSVTIVAPAEQQSAKSQAITVCGEFSVKQITLQGLENAECYALTGTPADCVCFGLRNLDKEYDCVMSGINLGANIGTDAFYSGTVGAAMEGALFGIPSVAVSLCSHTDRTNLQLAASWGVRALEYMFSGDGGKPVCELLSVNVPICPPEKIHGARLAPLCRNTNKVYKFDYEHDGIYSVPPWTTTCDGECDVGSVLSGYVTFTPISTDRCDHDALTRMGIDFDKKMAVEKL